MLPSESEDSDFEVSNKDKDFAPTKKGPPKSLLKVSTSWGEY